MTQNNSILYHGTSTAALNDIEDSGVIPPVSYWGSEDIAAYYADEVVEDIGGEPVLLAIDISALDNSLIEPDYAGIEEPLTFTLAKTEDDIWNAWYDSKQTWQDSLDIIGSVRYQGSIDIDAVGVTEDDHCDYELDESIESALDTVETYSPEDLAKKHNVSVADINKELAAGIKIEQEHTTDLKMARTIALDHLLEIPDYYTRLDRMERSYEVSEGTNADLVDKFFQSIITTRQFSDHGSSLDDFVYEFGGDPWWDTETTDDVVPTPEFQKGFRKWLTLRYNYAMKKLKDEIAQGGGFPLRVQRAIRVPLDWVPPPPNQTVSVRTEGVYWSTLTDPVPWGANPDAQSKDVILSALVDKTDIDWEETIRSRIDYMNGDVESEIQLRPDAKITIVNGNLAESFDSTPIKFLRISDLTDYAEYTFTYNDIEFFVYFDGVTKYHFEMAYGPTAAMGMPTFLPTGKGGVGPIIATVIAITKNFLSSRDMVDRISFDGNKEAKLSSFYDVLVEKMARELKFEYDRIDKGLNVQYIMYFDKDSIIESFDSEPVDFTRTSHEVEDGMVFDRYGFTIDGAGYYVALSHANAVGSVLYGSKATGVHPSGQGNANLVFATLLAIIKQYLTKYPEVKTLTFDGNKNNKLAKLYSVMVPSLAKRMGVTYKRFDTGTTDTFIVDVTSLTESKTPWLRITPTMMSQARANKSQIIVNIPAKEFLLLTTDSDDTRDYINTNAKTLSAYNRWAKMGDNDDFAAFINTARKNKWEADEHPDKPAFEKEYGSIIMPFLYIALSADGTMGKISGHEGRHRSAAAYKAGASTIPVALRLSPGKDMFPDVHFGAEYHITHDHLPEYIEGQYNGKLHPTKYWVVVEDDMQKGTRR